ncbi:MAG: hypothetical protein U5K69_08360 [Balneolaceae bacterium]|nr:hypothetical protein [Balneolaceae bacterium]
MSTLKIIFPQATKEQCQDFHENSFGIPRVQFYMLGEDKYLNQDASKDIKIQEVIGKQRITLEELFNDRVEAAVNLKGISVDTSFYMSALLLLFRPFTIEDYAKVVGLEPHNARRICKSLRPGLVISNKNYLRFRDEDFEKFLKAEFLGNVDKSKFHEYISQNLIDLIGKNNYASKYYAKHLYLAGQYDKLISQIFKQNELNDIEDDVTRLNIEKNHISIAIKAAQLCPSAGRGGRAPRSREPHRKAARRL